MYPTIYRGGKKQAASNATQCKIKLTYVGSRLLVISLLKTDNQKSNQSITEKEGRRGSLNMKLPTELNATRKLKRGTLWKSTASSLSLTDTEQGNCDETISGCTRATSVL